MALTTKDLIKLLPYTEEFKTDLLEKFDTLSADQEFNIVQILWDTYNALYELKLEENTRLAMQNVADGKDVLDKTFYDRVKEKTRQEMEQQQSEAILSEDLSDAREKLEELIKKTH